MLYSVQNFKLKFMNFVILEGVSRLVLSHTSTSLILDFLFLGNFLYQFARPGVKANPGKITWIFLKGDTRCEIKINILIHIQYQLWLVIEAFCKTIVKNTTRTPNKTKIMFQKIITADNHTFVLKWKTLLSPLAGPTVDLMSSGDQV